jgi:hypothetical protein
MRGRVKRLSLYTWRQPSRPLMQASPLLLGLFLSPVTLVMTPSSTVMARPQPTPQKPQIVLACLVSTAVSTAVAT